MSAAASAAPPAAALGSAAAFPGASGPRFPALYLKIYDLQLSLLYQALQEGAVVLLCHALHLLLQVRLLHFILQQLGLHILLTALHDLLLRLCVVDPLLQPHLLKLVSRSRLLSLQKLDVLGVVQLLLLHVEQFVLRFDDIQDVLVYQLLHLANLLLYVVHWLLIDLRQNQL